MTARAERHKGPDIIIPHDTAAQATCLRLDVNKQPAARCRNILQKPAKVTLKKTDHKSSPQSLKEN